MKEDFDDIEETAEERENRLSGVLAKFESVVNEEQNLDLDYYHSRVYIRNMKWYKKCKSAVAFQLLMYMMAHMDSRTGKVLFPASRRQEFVRQCDVSNQSVTNALRELCKVSVILPYKEDVPGPHGEETGEVLCPSGEYWVNPKMIWLGSENARRHAYLIMKKFYPKI